MTPLSVSFKGTLKAMNTIKFQIHVLLQLYVKKKAGAVLFPNDFPVNTLTHLCMNDFNFCAYCRLGKSEIAKINVFHLDPKPRKFEKKQRNDKISRFVACQIMGVSNIHIIDKQTDTKIYKYVV